MARMNEDKFWKLIEQSRAEPRTPQNENLTTLLAGLPVDQIVEFQNIYYRLRDDANIGSLYGAGSLISGRVLSDSTSDYFFNWLVAQGRSIYENALTDPDSLSEVPIAEDPWDEDVIYAAIEAFESLSDEDFYEKLSPVDYKDTDYDWLTYTGAYLKEHYPRLWAKYGESFRDD